MKKITKFENYMGQLINTTDLINYEQQSSSSINYNSIQNSSCPESFPVLMENGIIVRYELVKFASEIVSEQGVSNK
jgi:hypothetical protein